MTQRTLPITIGGHQAVIRLACAECDTDEGDGLPNVIAAIQLGWREVAYVGEANYADEEDSRWWDHLGHCPACAAPDDRPFADFAADIREVTGTR